MSENVQPAADGQIQAPSPSARLTFQFQTRTLLAVIAMFAVGLGLSVNASIGARLAFLISFSVFWLGVGCVTYVCDSRQRNIGGVLTILFGQMLVLTASTAMIASLCLILRSLLMPLVSS